MENLLIAAGFDAVQIAGPNTAVVVERIVAITDGAVTVELVKGIENPALNGIEIIASSASAPPAPVPTAPIPTAPIPTAPAPTAPIPTAPASTSTTTRINVGGGQFVDSTGNTWIADNYFGGKGAAYGSCPKAIANSVDDELYCTMRWFAPWHGPPFVYEIPVSSSSQYQVKLHFADIVSLQHPPPNISNTAISEFV